MANDWKEIAGRIARKSAELAAKGTIAAAKASLEIAKNSAESLRKMQAEARERRELEAAEKAAQEKRRCPPSQAFAYRFNLDDPHDPPALYVRTGVLLDKPQLQLGKLEHNFEIGSQIIRVRLSDGAIQRVAYSSDHHQTEDSTWHYKVTIIPLDLQNIEIDPEKSQMIGFSWQIRGFEIIDATLNTKLELPKSFDPRFGMLSMFEDGTRGNYLLSSFSHAILTEWLAKLKMLIDPIMDAQLERRSDHIKLFRLYKQGLENSPEYEEIYRDLERHYRETFKPPELLF